MPLLFNQIATPTIEAAKSFLVITYAVATFGVWFGVYLENEKFSPKIQRLGWMVLLIFLALETALGFLAAGADNELIQRQQREIEDLITPRTLTAEQQGRIVSKLRPYAGTAYVISVEPNPEAQEFVCVVNNILVSAGWRREEGTTGLPQPTRLITIATDCGQIPTFSISGLRVRAAASPSPALIQADTVVVAAFKAEGITTRAEMDPINTDAANQTIINIIVGAKPQPWEHIE